MNRGMCAPFPYFGGKRLWCDLIWEGLGQVDVYSEPFCGSAAVLLGRPGGHRGREVIGDASGFVANFWRAVRAAPAEVAAAADRPTVSADIVAARRWLHSWSVGAIGDLTACVRWYDAEAAGLWGWLQSVCIAGKSDVCSSGSRGVMAQSEARDFLPDGGRLRDWFEALAARLSRVVVLCGDWLGCVSDSRLMVTPGALSGSREVGVFLDPPYSGSSGVYGASEELAASAWEWALEYGERYRIVYCSMAGDVMAPAGWRSVRRQLRGFRRRTDPAMEQLLFSPRCHGEAQGLLAL